MLQRVGIWDAHCHFSLPICFSTDWKTTNERVYIFSSCLTQAEEQLGRRICSLSQALAVSPECLSLSWLPGPLALPDLSSSSHQPSPRARGLSGAQHDQQPHHVFCNAHTISPLPLFLSLVLFGSMWGAREVLGSCPLPGLQNWKQTQMALASASADIKAPVGECSSVL